jgi:hypothetical protein
MTRVLNAREIAVLKIPDVFGLPVPPTSGSIRITSTAELGLGFLGWFLAQRSNGVVFKAIGLDAFANFLLSSGDAP